MGRSDLIKFFEEELPKLPHQGGYKRDAAQLADAIIARYIVIEDTQVYLPPPEKLDPKLKIALAHRLREILAEK